MGFRDDASYLLLKSLIDQCIALEFTNNDLVDADFAVKLMEQTSATLQKLDRNDLLALQAILKNIASEYADSEISDYVMSFFENFGFDIAE